jgi:hypothetical protein
MVPWNPTRYELYGAYVTPSALTFCVLTVDHVDAQERLMYLAALELTGLETARDEVAGCRDAEFTPPPQSLQFAFVCMCRASGDSGASGSPRTQVTLFWHIL